MNELYYEAVMEKSNEGPDYDVRNNEEPNEVEDGEGNLKIVFGDKETDYKEPKILE